MRTKMRPDDRKYTKTHEWVKIDGKTVLIGITDHAVEVVQRQRGRLVYCDLPESGRRVEAGETFGEIESVKAVADLNAPVSGVVVEANPAIEDHLEILLARSVERGLDDPARAERRRPRGRRAHGRRGLRRVRRGLNDWRLLLGHGLAPGRQMALDEALLELGGATPVLRLYTWSRAFRLGYSQPRADVAPARAAFTGADGPPLLVRRFTGGGAIHHANELTFSIAAPIDHPLYAGPVAPSYDRVHAIVAAALARFGVHARARGERRLASERASSGMCFHRSCAQDLVWSGPSGPAKGVGSAQRRTRGRVLHHGSIKLAADPLEPGVATADLGGVAVDARELGDELVRAFEGELSARLRRDDPTPEESAHADARESFFGSEPFLALRDGARRRDHSSSSPVEASGTASPDSE
ncbi:MAG: hypothetical protein R3F34_01635 [Planctomycetota bacterium]